MIVEFLSYSVALAAFPDFIDDRAAAMFETVSAHLPLKGAFTPGTGTLNRIIFVAFHADYAARDAAWLGLSRSTAWRDFLRDPATTIKDVESTILNPAAFSPLHQPEDVDAVIALREGAEPMIFELRTYKVKPGQMPSVIKTLRDEGNALTHEFVEWPVAYFTAETGVTNRVMMFWAYSSAAERAERKSRMLPDPRFQELGSRFNPNFSQQRAEFLIPTEFSPLR
jgi:NIPSNAP